MQNSDLSLHESTKLKFLRLFWNRVLPRPWQQVIELLWFSMEASFFLFAAFFPQNAAVDEKWSKDWPPQWAAPAPETEMVRAPPKGRAWENSWCPACWRAARAQRCAARWMGRAAPMPSGHSETACCQVVDKGKANKERQKERKRKKYVINTDIFMIISAILFPLKREWLMEFHSKFLINASSQTLSLNNFGNPLSCTSMTCSMTSIYQQNFQHATSVETAAILEHLSQLWAQCKWQ